ncbi:MAG: DUF6625 family protein [Pseudomonadota bacterium]
MSKPPSICIIVHYFGEWPEWADMYIYSCGHNRDINWLIVSDCARDIFGFPNVTIKNMSLDEFRGLAKAKLGVDLQKVSANGLADLKPALGLMFEDEIAGYDYFGQSDIDVIYGDLRAFYNENIRGFDVVSAHDWIIAGHLSLFRNTEKIRNLFRLVPEWREQMESPKVCSLDEKGMTLLFWRDLKRAKGSRRTARKRGLHALFEEQFSTSFGGNIWIDKRQDTFPKQWKWKDGKVYAHDVFERHFAYCHFSHLQSGRWRPDGVAPWHRHETILQFDPKSRPREFVLDGAGIRLPGRLPMQQVKKARKGAPKVRAKKSDKAKWCLFTAYDSHLADMAEITVPNMQRYADRHGMELRAYDNRYVDRRPHWLKVQLARELLEEDFDFIFWVDTDAIFVDLETSIKDEIEDDKDLYFCVENQAILGTHSRTRINSGVFVLRNTQLTRDFLDVVWKTSAFEEHDWSDQAAIIAVLGLNSMFMEEHRGEDFIDSRFHDALKIMDIRWNYCPTYADAVDGETSVHHYFGLDNISKEVCLRFEATALDLVERGLMEKAAAKEIAFKSFRKLHLISEKQAAMKPLLGAYQEVSKELRSLKAGPIRRVKDHTRKVKSRFFNGAKS